MVILTLSKSGPESTRISKRSESDANNINIILASKRESRVQFPACAYLLTFEFSSQVRIRLQRKKEIYCDKTRL